MKQNRYWILFIAAGIITLSSCKKQLDLQPTDTINENNAFLTISDVQQGANEAYVRYGNAYINDIYVSALTSDEGKLGIDNAGQGTLTYRYQYSADATAGGDVIASFGGYYAVIDQVNRVLPFISTVTGSSVEEPRRNILKGQLLALRAISHFGLLQSYSKNYDPADTKGIPIMLVSDPLGKPARNTMAEVMTQIEKDLSDAKALLPVETASTFQDTVMNSINITAYQARIALYKRDYANAALYSGQVIASNVKPLANRGDFPGIWTDINFYETLFRVRYATSAVLGSLWTTTGGQYYISPSDKLFATYNKNDIRKGTYIGTTGSNTNFVNKYYTSSRGGRIVDLKACRIAEMYLIREEANAKSTTPNLLAPDLNFLRGTRILLYIPEAFTSADDLLTAVLTERFKELCFEGFRFWDLKRNNLPVERNASDANAAWQTLPANSFRFVLPIPRSEILLNPNMVQNDGY